MLTLCLVNTYPGESHSLRPAASAYQIQDSLKAAMDSLRTAGSLKLRLSKKNAHASYYADRLTGRRTASGKRFDNSKYTAAHRKFPFGTKLRITNEANGKSVIVEVTDRGPFSRGRDIDLTKRAFMDIAGGRYGGSLRVTIEEILK
jgi:rare lipoprotein A